jgi:hypothetical protein
MFIKPKSLSLVFKGPLIIYYFLINLLLYIISEKNFYFIVKYFSTGLMIVIYVLWPLLIVFVCLEKIQL